MLLLLELELWKVLLVSPETISHGVLKEMPSRFSSVHKFPFIGSILYKSRKPKSSSSNTKFSIQLAAVERSEVMEENSLQVDETGDNDELSEI